MTDVAANVEIVAIDRKRFTLAAQRGQLRFLPGVVSALCSACERGHLPTGMAYLLWLHSTIIARNWLRNVASQAF